MVGCVVVNVDGVAHEGWHMEAGGLHAEIEALERAGEGARGGIMYVSLEPCAHHGRTPPCVDRIVAAGLSKVFVAMADPDPRNDGRGLSALRDAGIEVETGLLADSASWLNRGFVSRVTRGRPWLRLKTASSMDGRVALDKGKGVWITGKDARKMVHDMRAESCAVMTGSGTALADDPRLTARDVGADRQPLRFLVDSKARCPASLRLYDSVAVLATASEPPQGLGEGVEVLRLADEEGKVDLEGLLFEMSSRWQVNSLMVEAGPGLAGALLSKGLVDEVSAFLAPCYLGAGVSVADFFGVGKVEDAARFKVRDVRAVGDDALLTLIKD